MITSHRGAAWTRAVIVQLGIVAGLLVLYKFYLPKMQRDKMAADTTARERRIQAFAKLMIVDDPNRQAEGIGANGEGLSHPQKLLQEDSMNEVQQTLGAPVSQFSDIGGGQHLTWTGTDHKLEAAFNKGALYNLTYSNLHTSHGVTVFESSQYWQSF